MQIESKKLEWNVTSKVGSLDNADHKPGGGDKKVIIDYLLVSSCTNAIHNNKLLSLTLTS